MESKQTENKAEKAFKGDEQYIPFGRWQIEDKPKVVAFRGEKAESACYVKSEDDKIRENAEHYGKGEHSFTVSKGETVFAIAAFIKFSDVADLKCNDA